MKPTILVKITCAAFALTLCISDAAWSQSASENGERRGLITTGPCPLSCEDLGVAREFCRERVMGAKCSVEDFSQAPGHRSMIRVPGTSKSAAPQKEASTRSFAESSDDFSGPADQVPAADPNRRGLVTSAQCPYTCKQARIPEGYCRERKVGSLCQVEDLRQVPGHRSMIRIP